MSQQFPNKVVVVVGGNSGIGLATAKAFACEGAQVVITGRNQDTLRMAAEQVGGRAVAHHSDISDLRQIQMLFREIQREQGRIDVLFVSAGVLAVSPIEAVTETDWTSLHDINLKGVFFTVQAALPLMSAGSSIVLCSSTAAYRGVATASVYAASKAGILALGRCFAAELLDRGIRVNVVSPGPIQTPIFDRVMGLSEGSGNKLRAEQIGSVPLKRMGESHEVAAAVLFIAGGGASFMTGADILVDGGAIRLEK